MTPVCAVAGRSVPGLRLHPSDPRTTISHVDVWADAATGLPVKVEIYGASGGPVLSSAFLDLTISTPAAATTGFTPPPGAHQSRAL